MKYLQNLYGTLHPRESLFQYLTESNKTSTFIINEPQRQKTYLRNYAPSGDSDQPVHSRSVIRTFTGCILE